MRAFSLSLTHPHARTPARTHTHTHTHTHTRTHVRTHARTHAHTHARTHTHTHTHTHTRMHTRTDTHTHTRAPSPSSTHSNYMTAVIIDITVSQVYRLKTSALSLCSDHSPQTARSETFAKLVTVWNSEQIKQNLLTKQPSATF